MQAARKADWKEKMLVGLLVVGSVGWTGAKSVDWMDDEKVAMKVETLAFESV